jgi:hypothetical protein
MDFTGKPLKSMVSVEPSGIASDDALRTWIELAITYVKALPVKQSATR